MGLFKSVGVVYKPVDQIDLGPDSDQLYLSPLVKAPRMAGFLVKLFAWILETKFIGMMLLYFLKKDNLVHKLVSFAELEESPVFVPVHLSEDVPEQNVKCLDSKGNPNDRVQQAVECLPTSRITSDEMKPSFYRWTIMDYSKAYSSGALTPTMVAESFIRSVERSSKSKCNMAFFISYDPDNILSQAAESTLRYKNGNALSVLDGVPIAIKDEIDCSPYPTTGGTKWLHKYRHSEDDASCVKSLRLCGAILVGKTNMHELGAGTSGINPHYGVARNPYDTSRVTGGSSSGSAAVVSAGLCPVALGVDGGGSVRMPAALCGVVGFKPTFGRIPHDGVLPLNCTVGMVGILSGTIEDALITYATISGAVSSSVVSEPKLQLPLLRPNAFLGNIKMAKYEKWFNDCSDDIKLCCTDVLDKLLMCYGWKTVEVTVPEIETMRLAHYITIGSECTAALDHLLQNLNGADHGWDIRVALSVYGAFSGMEYIKAQKFRSRQMQFHRKIFSEADVIVTPTTGVTAYPIKEDAIVTGELDYINGGILQPYIHSQVKQLIDVFIFDRTFTFFSAALVRYQIAGNFLGLPAVTVPIGYDKAGLPIGLQFIGRPWSEAKLLHIAYAVQALCISEYRKPEIFYDLLNQT